MDLANYGRKPDPKKEYQRSLKGKGRPPKSEPAKPKEPEPKKETPPPKEEDNEDLGLDLGEDSMLGMFDEEAAAKVQPAEVVEVAPVIFVDMATPKSWTGKTPKTCLLDWNR